MDRTDIDVLAFHEEKRWLLPCECTGDLGEIGRKIRSLSERAMTFAKKFDSWHVQKVLFTSRDAESAMPFLEEATQARVRLVCADAIQTLEDAVRLGHPIEGLWHAFRNERSTLDFVLD